MFFSNPGPKVCIRFKKYVQDTEEAEGPQKRPTRFKWPRRPRYSKLSLTAVWNGLSKKYTISFLSIIGSKLEHLGEIFFLKTFSMEMIETFWGGKEDASLARDNFLGCQETLELLEKG